VVHPQVSAPLMHAHLLVCVLLGQSGQLHLPLAQEHSGLLGPQTLQLLSGHVQSACIVDVLVVRMLSDGCL